MLIILILSDNEVWLWIYFSDEPNYILAKTAQDCPEAYKVVETAVNECQYACKALGITKFVSEERFSEGEKCFVNRDKHCSQSGEHGADARFVCSKQGNLI